jgi:Tfp pilus assembly protein PilN
MKAVNLIPADESTGRSGRSGVAVYGVLGVLALLVALSALYTLAGKSEQDKRQALAALTAQADATEAKATRLKTYAQYSDARKARVETVRSLADSRFDWSQALSEVGRTLPAGTWVKSLRATVNPSVTVDGTPDVLRSALAVPAIEATGCASTQANVARAIVALRAMAGVQRVSLSDSKKASSGAGGNADSAAAGSDSCGSGPKFSMTIFFEAPAASTAASTSAASGGTTP